MIREITIQATHDSDPKKNYVRYFGSWTDGNGDILHTTDDYADLRDVFGEIFFKFNPNNKFLFLFKNNPYSMYSFDFIKYLSQQNQ